MCLAGCVAGRSCSHAARIGSRSLCSRRSSSLAFFRNMVVPVGSSLMEVMVDRTVAGSAFCRAICRTSVCTVESRCSRKSCFGLDNGGNAVPLGWVPLPRALNTLPVGLILHRKYLTDARGVYPLRSCRVQCWCRSRCLAVYHARSGILLKFVDLA